MRKCSKGEVLRAAAMVLGALVFLWLLAIPSGLGLDTEQYIDFSDAILNGQILERQPLDEIHRGLAIRTPFFPVMISIPRFFWPGDWMWSTLILHTVEVGTLCVLLWWSFAGQIKLEIVAGAFVGVLIGFQQFFSATITEFTALMLLVAFFTLLFRWFMRRSISGFLTLTLLASCMVLNRPAMLPILPLLMLIAIWISIKDRRDFIYPLAVGCIPILIWMGFNYYRFDRFTLTLFSGNSLFTLGSTLGLAEVAPDDSPEFKRFIEAINSSKLQAEDELLSVHSFANDKELARILHHNENLSWKVAGEQQLNFMVHDDFKKEYAIRALRTSVQKHLVLVKSALIYVWDTWIVLGILAWLTFRAGRSEPAASLLFATWGIGLFHVLHMALIVCSQPGPWGRYYITTLLPVLFGTGLSLYAYCTQGAIARENS